MRIFSRYNTIHRAVQFPLLVYLKNIVPEIFYSQKTDAPVIREFKDYTCSYLFNIDLALLNNYKTLINLSKEFQQLFQDNNSFITNKKTGHYQNSLLKKQSQLNFNKLVNRLNQRLSLHGMAPVQNSVPIEGDIVRENIFRDGKNPEKRVKDIVGIEVQKNSKDIINGQGMGAALHKKIEAKYKMVKQDRLLENRRPQKTHVLPQPEDHPKPRPAYTERYHIRKVRTGDNNGGIRGPQSKASIVHKISDRRTHKQEKREVISVNSSMVLECVTGSEITKKLFDSYNFKHTINDMINKKIEGKSDQIYSYIYKKAELNSYRRGTF